MIVEPTLAHGDRGVTEETPEGDEVASSVKRRGVVGMDAGCGEDKPGILHSAISGCGGRGQRFTNADNCGSARFAGAGYYRVAVTGERRVREVGVAVDEDRRASVLRGHLRSIQRRTGAAT
jgi:hypothetical protein